MRSSSPSRGLSVRSTVAALPLSTAVDYDISLPSLSITSASPYLTGALISGQFSIASQGGNAGGFPINYSLFASADAVLGPQDYLVASGSTPQLAALETATVSFDSVRNPGVATALFTCRTGISRLGAPGQGAMVDNCRNSQEIAKV